MAGQPTNALVARAKRTKDLTSFYDPDGVVSTRYMDEYKMLQDKIDKIGAFQFTIKGWSVTLVIASLFATYKLETLDPYAVIGVIFVFLFFFFSFEKRQLRLSLRFGQRSLEIESILGRLDKRCDRQTLIRDAAPTVADMLTRPAGHWTDAVSWIPKWVKRARTHEYMRADFPFYVCLGISVLIGGVVQHQHLTKIPDKEVTTLNNSYSKGGSVPVAPEQTPQCIDSHIDHKDERKGGSSVSTPKNVQKSPNP